MTLSRSTRILILLVINVMFFFTELIVGYAVHSLALVADSFHMLNDVMSLLVAFYAIKLTNKSSSADSRYSYGWHRAEILAALVNGVFLLALCFSIFLEALGRFYSKPDVSNPRLVVIVGSLGLASNILGLFLFHEHGHSHSHKHSGDPESASEPRATDSQPTIDVIPASETASGIALRERTREQEDEDNADSLYGHPAATRASLVQTAADIALSSSQELQRSASRAAGGGESMIVGNKAEDSMDVVPVPSLGRNRSVSELSVGGHGQEARSRPHGHSHGGMNMRALVLHVMGDAIGNVGVIGTGLIMWLTTWSFRFYFDPAVSIIISIIIFSSALPLVRSACFILLQGVPAGVSLDDVRSSILSVPGVLSLHELHIWQLSETKAVASVHVTVNQERTDSLMGVAAEIRKSLHHHGVHSCTIQPEYPGTVFEEREGMRSDASLETSCLIRCPPDQQCSPAENACCPPPLIDV